MKFWVRIAKAYQGLTNFGRRQTFVREIDLANFAQLPGLTGSVLRPMWRGIGQQGNAGHLSALSV